MRRPRLIRYFPTAGDTLGWAIDEDLRLLRGALDGAAQETSLAKADVVHATYWPHLFFHHPRLLENRFVIAHADNPPFFYLTQPSFSRAQNLVDLWVARSSEASGQFRALHLPCVHIPYAVDTALFHPIADRSALRRKHGIPEDAYVIANFHRDSEGADVSRPKLQKAIITAAVNKAITFFWPVLVATGCARSWNATRSRSLSSAAPESKVTTTTQMFSRGRNSTNSTMLAISI
ncbi:MAG: hypothetical protein ACO3L2_06070 [Chthoniobacterales bacterium]